MDVAAWIQTAIYLIPLATVIWKAAQLSADLKQAKKDIEDLRRQDSLLTNMVSSISGALNDIKVAMARIETKLEEKNI